MLEVRRRRRRVRGWCGRSRRSGSGRRDASRRAGRRRPPVLQGLVSPASRKPPLRTGMPRARWPGARPAARPARVPPVPQATATTSARSRSSSPRSWQPRTARALLPPSGTTYASSASAGAQDGGQGRRLGLAAVRRPVDEVQPHAVGRAAGQGRVEGAVGQFLAADHADGGQAQEAARGGGGAQVVGVGAAEGEQRAAGRRRAGSGPACATCCRQLRMDQVVPLEQQPDAVAGEALVRDLLERGGQPGVQGRGGVGGGGLAGHVPIVGHVTGGCPVRPCDRAATSGGPGRVLSCRPW